MFDMGSSGKLKSLVDSFLSKLSTKKRRKKEQGLQKPDAIASQDADAPLTPNAAAAVVTAAAGGQDGKAGPSPSTQLVPRSGQANGSRGSAPSVPSGHQGHSATQGSGPLITDNNAVPQESVLEALESAAPLGEVARPTSVVWREGAAPNAGDLAGVLFARGTNQQRPVQPQQSTGQSALPPRLVAGYQSMGAEPHNPAAGASSDSGRAMLGNSSARLAHLHSRGEGGDVAFPASVAAATASHTAHQSASIANTGALNITDALVSSTDVAAMEQHAGQSGAQVADLEEHFAITQRAQEPLPPARQQPATPRPAPAGDGPWHAADAFAAARAALPTATDAVRAADGASAAQEPPSAAIAQPMQQAPGAPAAAAPQAQPPCPATATAATSASGAAAAATGGTAAATPAPKPVRLTTACLGAHTTLAEGSADQSFHRMLQRKMKQVQAWLQASDLTVAPAEQRVDHPPEPVALGPVLASNGAASRGGSAIGSGAAQESALQRLARTAAAGKTATVPGALPAATPAAAALPGPAAAVASTAVATAGPVAPGAGTAVTAAGTASGSAQRQVGVLSAPSPAVPRSPVPTGADASLTPLTAAGAAPTNTSKPQALAPQLQAKGQPGAVAALLDPSPHASAAAAAAGALQGGNGGGAAAPATGTQRSAPPLTHPNLRDVHALAWSNSKGDSSSGRLPADVTPNALSVPSHTIAHHATERSILPPAGPVGRPAGNGAGAGNGGSSSQEHPQPQQPLQQSSQQGPKVLQYTLSDLYGSMAHHNGTLPPRVLASSAEPLLVIRHSAVAAAAAAANPAAAAAGVKERDREGHGRPAAAGGQQRTGGAKDEAMLPVGYAPRQSSAAHSRTKIIAVASHCPEELAAGQQQQQVSIEDFTLLKKLYEGSLSIVCQAQHKRSGRHVALKIYKRSRLHEMERFQLAREICLHIRIVHPFIVQLYAAWKDSKYVYLALEWAPRGNLFDYLVGQGGRLAEGEAARVVMRPLLSGLAFLHEQHFIHRDVKLENIVLDGSLNIKLADFGLAIDQKFEQANTQLGTFGYFAPEVLDCPLKKGPFDFKDASLPGYNSKVDVWSAGVVAYEVLTGRAPFSASSAPKILEAIRSRVVEFPSFLSEEARDFVGQALTREPGARPTARQLLVHPWIVRHCGEPDAAAMAAAAAGALAAAAADAAQALAAGDASRGSRRAAGEALAAGGLAKAP